MTGNGILRLATWNIHMAVGLDRRRDLGRIATVIRQIDPDVIGLQEVDNHVDDQGDDVQGLRNMTGLEVHVGPTLQKPTGDYGNALLTRLPVRQIERHEISVPGREPRGLLIAHLDWQGGIIRVAVTHLGLRPGERRLQVRQLIENLSADNPSPLVLMGDFNEWLFWGRPLRWLYRHFGRSRSPATFPAVWPFLRLDHILSDPHERLHSLETVRNRLTRVASDHLPLVASYRH
ncbi:MAG: endonuclease/exonuclease/phosphatase family protein [Desulfuromonadales bacterium]|jgi:endonuclease/exonuclease/phosphatase family metal-dependent hydrolase